MSTDRSENLHAKWRESTEKFDYFILGVISALCAYIGQGYKASIVGINPGTLELIALLTLVLAAVAGFRRIEKTMLLTLVNQRHLHANEARGGMIAKMNEGGFLLNHATGQTYTPQQAQARIPALTKTIETLELQVKPTADSALRHYHIRNALTLCGFLLVLGARVWTAYT